MVCANISPRPFCGKKWLFFVSIAYKNVPYFFNYKTEFFPFQNNPKNLDLSYKMDQNPLELFKKGKTCAIAKFHRTLI